MLAVLVLSSAALVVVICLFGLMFWFVRGGGGRRRGVLLVGPSSGKTALFHRVREGRFVPTVASMRENEATFVWAGDEAAGARLTVDVPGHGRLRWRARDFFPLARAAVVVLDAAAMGGEKYAKEAATFVWDALFCGHPLRVVVACNKSDDLLALAPKRIRALLETHLTALSRTRSKYPQFQDAETDEAPAVASAEGEQRSEVFSFDSAPLPVEFVVISAKKGDLKQLFDALK